MKSCNPHDLYNYQRVIAENYDQLWEFHLRKTLKKEQFRVYTLKQKCLDRFVNQFGKVPLTVAYGAASIRHTGKSELSVPVSFVYDNVRHYNRPLSTSEISTLYNNGVGI